MADHVPPEARELPAYNEGRQAFSARTGVSVCPYTRGVNRTAWLTGYYDARTEKRVGAILERHGETWP